MRQNLGLFEFSNTNVETCELRFEMKKKTVLYTKVHH